LACDGNANISEGAQGVVGAAVASGKNGETSKAEEEFDSERDSEESGGTVEESAGTKDVNKEVEEGEGTKAEIGEAKADTGGAAEAEKAEGMAEEGWDSNPERGDRRVEKKNTKVE